MTEIDEEIEGLEQDEEKEEAWQEGLPRREVLFVENFCMNPRCFLNATEAYRITFDKGANKVVSCATAGCRMANRPRVRRAIKMLLADRQRTVDVVTTHKVLDIIRTVATTSPAELMDDSGRMRPLSELGDKAMCITDVIPTESGLKPVLAKRERYLELFMRYANLVREEVKIDVTLPVVEVVPKAADADEWNEANG